MVPSETTVRLLNQKSYLQIPGRKAEPGNRTGQPHLLIN